MGYFIVLRWYASQCRTGFIALHCNKFLSLTSALPWFFQPVQRAALPWFSLPVQRAALPYLGFSCLSRGLPYLGFLCLSRGLPYLGFPCLSRRLPYPWFPCLSRGLPYLGFPCLSGGLPCSALVLPCLAIPPVPYHTTRALPALLGCSTLCLVLDSSSCLMLPCIRERTEKSASVISALRCSSVANQTLCTSKQSLWALSATLCST